MAQRGPLHHTWGVRVGRPPTRGPGKASLPHRGWPVRKGASLSTEEQGPLPSSCVLAGREAREDGRKGNHTRGLGTTSQGWRGGWAQRCRLCGVEGGISQQLCPRDSQGPSAISGNSAGTGLGKNKSQSVLCIPNGNVGSPLHTDPPGQMPQKSDWQPPGQLEPEGRGQGSWPRIVARQEVDCQL